MSQSKQLIFYTFWSSQHAHRAQLALEETKSDYISYEVDLNPSTKPKWYNEKIDPPHGLVPAVLYGGTPCTPDNPSSDATIVSGSLQVIEFLDDVFPDSGIMPKDPSERAKVRAFVALAQETFISGFYAAFYRGKSALPLLDALEQLQARLPAKGFAGGRWSMAEMALAPFIVRAWMMWERDIGKYPEGQGKQIMETLRGDSKYERIMRYVEDIKAYPTFKATWDETKQLSAWGVWSGVKRGAPLYKYTPGTF